MVLWNFKNETFHICKWPWDTGGLCVCASTQRSFIGQYPSHPNLKIYHHPYWLFNFDLSFCLVQCMPWNRDVCLYWTEKINLSLCLPHPRHPMTMKCVHSWQLLIPSCLHLSGMCPVTLWTERWAVLWGNAMLCPDVRVQGWLSGVCLSFCHPIWSKFSDL